MTNQPIEMAVEERNRIPLPALQEEFAAGSKYHLVRIPEEVSEELAENVGIHISDGYMGNEGGTCLVQYSGHAIDDFPYYTFRFVPLLKRLWGTSRISYKGVKGEQSLKIRIYSKQLTLFKHKIWGLPFGKKETITIPEYFLKDPRISYVLLRGLFDGDGSLSFKSKWGLGHTYPVISYSSLSKPLIKQLHWLLGRLGFTLPEKLQTKNEGTTFVLSINGDKNYERWMNTIRFNNPKHLTKVLLYEIFGIVPPGTELIDRVKLIRRELELSAIYPVKKLRINNNRVTEKKVLEKLAQGQNTIERLGKLTQLENYIVKATIRRLSKMGLVKRVQTKRDDKNIYRIALWGINKLHRVQKIVNRLREEYHLAV